MNLDKARLIFFEEAREQCDVLEGGLLSDAAVADAGSAHDLEFCNRLFRTAHTIKGTAGIFGLTALVRLAHSMENVLERLRTAELQLDKALVELLLQCTDHLRSLIDEGEQGQNDPSLDNAAGLALLQALAQWSGEPAAAQDAELGPAIILANPSESEPRPIWHITLRFGLGLFRRGLDPFSLLKYLTELGELRMVRPVWRDWPMPQMLDAMDCYLGYELQLASDAAPQKIAQSFDFFREDCFVGLLPLKAPASEFLQLAQALAAWGEDGVESQLALWLACGALSAQDLAPLKGVVASDCQPPPTCASPAASPAKLAAPAPEAIPAAALPGRRLGASASIRVEAAKLDRLINRVGELVIAMAGNKSYLLQSQANPKLESVDAMLSMIEGIRDDALGLRMVPMAEVFDRFPRLVRQVSAQLGKQVRVELSGTQAEIDKAMVEQLSEALTHLIRNALDHGIESPQQRRDSGKPEQGVLRLAARHEGGALWVEVRDDGQGMSRERILAKALERGLIQEGCKLSDSEVFELIFLPGFSTAAAITETSGRGVGMDVVKRCIEAMRGQIELTSQVGLGACISLCLPLTLSIVDGFRVEVAGAAYVMPLAAVQECMQPSAQSLGPGLRQLGWHGDYLPLLCLRELFGLPPRAGDAFVVVVNFGSKRAGVVVDRLGGEMQAVIKPLGVLFRALRGICGSTILGDGQPALVLDIQQLIQLAQSQEQLWLRRHGDQLAASSSASP